MDEHYYYYDTPYEFSYKLLLSIFHLSLIDHQDFSAFHDSKYPSRF